MAPNRKIHSQITTSLYFFPWIALERACGAQLLETRGSLNVNPPPAVSLNRYLPTHPSRVLTFLWERGTVEFWPELSGGNTACQRTLPSFETIHSSIHAASWRLWPLNLTSWRYFSEAPGRRREQSQKPKQHVWQSGCLPSDWLGSTPSFTLWFSNWAAHLWLAPMWYLIHQWQFVYPSTDRAVPSRTSILAYWLCLFLVQNPYTAVELSIQWGVRPFLRLSPPPISTSYVSLLLTHLHCSGRQSCFIQSSLAHPSIPFSPGDYSCSAWLLTPLSHQAERRRSTDTPQLNRDMQAMQKRPRNRAVREKGEDVIEK